MHVKVFQINRTLPRNPAIFIGEASSKRSAMLMVRRDGATGYLYSFVGEGGEFVAWDTLQACDAAIEKAFKPKKHIFETDFVR